MKKNAYILLFFMAAIFLIGSSGCKKDEGDTTKPVIQIVGPDPYVTCVGAPFVDPGARATDDQDGDITDRIEVEINVDTNQQGTGTVTYTVKDNAGNTDTKTRTVNVIFCR